MRLLLPFISALLMPYPFLTCQCFIQEYHPVKTECTLEPNIRHFHYIRPECFGDTVMIEFHPNISIINLKYKQHNAVISYSNYLTSYWLSLRKVQLSTVPGFKPLVNLRYNNNLNLRPLLLQVQPYITFDSLWITNKFVIWHNFEKNFGILKSGISVYTAIGYGFTVYSASDTSYLSIPHNLPYCSGQSGNSCKVRYVYLHNKANNEVFIYNQNSRLVGLLYMRELDSGMIMEPLYNFNTMKSVQTTTSLNLSDLQFKRRKQKKRFAKWLRNESY
jgi:hypothetical protein